MIQLLRQPACHLARLHRCQTGSISIVSVIALLLLTILLGMVMNSGRQIDQKIKMQNAADAATYSGGIVLTRGMNTLAFTNHLLSDVFALTAFFREARDQMSRQFPPEILDAWARIGPFLSTSEFPKFAALGQAIVEKTPLERDLVDTYSEWAAAASEAFLPIMETILAERLIPEFQRSLVQATPAMAQAAAGEVARRHAEAWPRPARLHAVIWRTFVEPVGGDSEAERRTLPVVDPVMDAEPNQQAYAAAARRQRDRLAHRYLNDWNNETMAVFDHYAKMSQFGNLWRTFTCGQLRRLLEKEYPDTNLPFQIRDEINQITDVNGHLGLDFQFIGVVYRERLEDRVPGVFQNPVAVDTEAFAQIMMFVPRGRLIWWNEQAREESSGNNVPAGGVPGNIVPLPTSPDPGEPPANPGDPSWYVTRQDWVRRWIESEERYVYFPANDLRSEAWNLINQNWTLQLVPATTTLLNEILSQHPGLDGMDDIEVPNLRALDESDLLWLNNH